jgi:hypothetical protein
MPARQAKIEMAFEAVAFRFRVFGVFHGKNFAFFVIFAVTTSHPAVPPSPHLARTRGI